MSARCKHTYTDELAPMNTGSISRPARFNLRLDCSTRARTIKLFSTAKDMFQNREKNGGFAEVWEQYLLPCLEHVFWHMKECKSIERQLMQNLFRPIEYRDTMRGTYQRLQMSFDFEAKKEVQNA